jgi:hypothetical protein
MKIHCILLTATIALGLTSQAQACDYLTEHFELCAEGTDWANGTWEQGGDSATLYLGKIGFEAFEDYLGHDATQTIGAELNTVMASWADTAKIDHHSRDSLKTPDLKIVRTIDTLAFSGDAPTLRVTMIAVSHRQRIMLMVSAPPDTPLDTLDKLSQAYAGLIRPALPVPEN